LESARVITRRVGRFFDERLGTGAVLRIAFKKIYPDHWSFYLGEFALYCFVLLVITGVWLTFVYDPSTSGAYPSVLALGRNDPIGYLIRQVHHWSAVVFVAAIIVHMTRIFFTAAFRKPREINWVIGTLLLVLASLTGFTGYSLPNDALSGTGLRIGMSVALSIPFIGAWASNLVNGGAFPGPLLLPHLYTIHAYFLPVLIAVLLSLHLGIMVLQKHTQFARDETVVVGRRFFPDYLLRTIASLGATVTIVVALAAVVEINPIERFGEYRYWLVPNPATPDWYAGWLDGALRLGPAVEWRIFGHPVPAVFWPGLVLPGIALMLIIAWPWIDARLTRDTKYHDVLVPPSAAPWRVGVGTALLTAGVVLTLAATDDQQALALHLPIMALVTIYQLAFAFGTIAVGLVAMVLASNVRARRDRHGAESERVIALVRNDQGGFNEEPVRSA
jgi:ubiquinol-cytochrome c reductase cytochrome b subunit